MHLRSSLLLVVLGLFIFAGCAQRILVKYDQVERTNRVKIVLTSGKKIEGTVVKADPYQLTLIKKNRQLKTVPRSSIRYIKRQPPVYDDFGRGISEEEIQSVKTNKNTLIYGVGGGALSFGASFFVGSLVVGQSKENGGTILGATTLLGGGLGTGLFIHAGNARDRREAMEKIREKRRSVKLKRGEVQKKSPDDMQKFLEQEKKKQEQLRKQREELLRQLKIEKKKKKENG